MKDWWLTTDCSRFNFSAISFTESSPESIRWIMRMRVVSPKNLKNSESSNRVSRFTFFIPLFSFLIYEHLFIFSYIDKRGRFVKSFCKIPLFFRFLLLFQRNHHGIDARSQAFCAITVQMVVVKSHIVRIIMVTHLVFVHNHKIRMPQAHFF